MAPFEHQNDTATLEKNPTVENTDLMSRTQKIREKYRDYFWITFDELRVASRTQTEELKTWALEFAPNEEEVAEREKWYELDYAKKIVAAHSLHQDFMSKLDEASMKRFISKKSREKWIARFRNSDVGYKEKEYWVTHQMPHYMTAWSMVSEERGKLIKNPGFKDLLTYNPKFAVIDKEEEFLDLHYELRKGLLAEARAALLAAGKLQLDLFAKAKDKLQGAASRKFLADGKVGVWLERIFKSHASPKNIEQFVSGSGPNSLSDLMIRWFEVHQRYEKVAANFTMQGNAELPRGAHLMGVSQFLNLHYTQRLRYVEEMENRLGRSTDLSHEPDSFIVIRHAMDTKDWLEAAQLIEKAKKEPLSADARTRLESMKRYVTQFTVHTDSVESMVNVTQAKERLDTLVHELGHSHPEMKTFVLRLLRGPHANRSIHQLRWAQYNNGWTRTHGPPYLDDEIARNSASKDHVALTKYRSEHGMDTGLHDALDYETCDGSYFRKQEIAKHKATLMSANVSSGGVMNTLAEKFEHEQPASWLYWTTPNWHVDGDPKSANWNNDFFHILTEMRSLTRVIGNAGFMYSGSNSPLIGLN